MAAVKEMLRTVGLRSTAARIAVIQCLASAAVPLSHAEVTDRLENFGFDQSTLYRCLMELAEAGLMAKLDLGDSIRRFEMITGEPTGTSEHPHFMCIDCGRIDCLSDFAVRLMPRKAGKKPPGEITEVLIKGHCSTCR